MGEGTRAGREGAECGEEGRQTRLGSAGCAPGWPRLACEVTFAQVRTQAQRAVPAAGEAAGSWLWGALWGWQLGQAPLEGERVGEARLRGRCAWSLDSGPEPATVRFLVKDPRPAGTLGATLSTT